MELLLGNTIQVSIESAQLIAELSKYAQQVLCIGHRSLYLSLDQPLEKIKTVAITL